MNSLDALRLMVDHFPGGRPVMAVRLGLELDPKGECEVLRKELSGSASHKLGVIRAHQISEICMDAKSPHCYAYVNTVCGSAGRMLELPVREMTEPVSMQRSTSDVIREMSDVVTMSLESGNQSMSDNEAARQLKEVHEAYAALQRHEQNIRAANAAGKPAHVRAVA